MKIQSKNFLFQDFETDWKNFGGWTTPSIKQYIDNVDNEQCGINMDLDWYP